MIDWPGLLSRVNAAYGAGQCGEAAALLEPALKLPSVPAEAWNLAALVRLAQGLGADALKAAKRAAAMAPKAAGVLNTLGLACEAENDAGGAERAFRRAADLRPDVAIFHYNLGKCLTRQRRWEPALVALRNALRCDPRMAAALNNMGVCQKNLGRYDEAEASLRHALSLRPDYPEAAYNLATLFLLLGRFEEGWPLYEQRWAISGNNPRNPANSWDGRPLEGESLLLLGEQGYGDVLQFIRLATRAAERGARVVVDCDPALTRLVATVPGVSKVYASGTLDEPVQWRLPIASLPVVLGWRPEDPLNARPYFAAPADGPALPPGTGLKVGVVWGGNRKPDPARTCPMASFRALFDVPGVTFYSLQMGEWRADLAGLPPARRPIDMSPLIREFADSAALMTQMDVVISIDSAPAHLAGALGVPVWVLLPQWADWRWLSERDDSPWYPTMRLFRQKRQDDWRPVIAQVAESLRAAATGR